MPTATIEADKVLCEYCNTYVDPADMADEFACNDCYTWHTCTICGGQFHDDDMAEYDICTDCAVDHERCDNCLEWTGAEDFVGRRCYGCHTSRLDDMVCDHAPDGVSWEDWTAWAEKSASLDFGCNFDCAGKCAKARSTKNTRWLLLNSRACCTDCADHTGYLVYIAPESLEIVKALYNDDTGFWRPGGCALPASCRSNTCLTYVCGSARRSDNYDNAGVVAWENELVQLSDL